MNLQQSVFFGVGDTPVNSSFVPPSNLQVSPTSGPSTGFDWTWVLHTPCQEITRQYSTDSNFSNPGVETLDDPTATHWDDDIYLDGSPLGVYYLRLRVQLEGDDFNFYYSNPVTYQITS